MGILDTIFGRTKPVKANLDALFALPAAAVTLQVSAGLVPTGKAGVCFKPPAGQPFEEVQGELEQLLEVDDTGDGKGAAPGTAAKVHHVGDKYGYRWIVVEGGAIDDLVTRVHMVHSSLADAGWGTQLLCSVFGFAPSGATDVTDAVSRPVFLVYLAKRGTFYPFAPSGAEERDNELELRLKGVVGGDLPVEEDLTRWFPIWDLPIA
ncbi:MAG: PspA-associated protein PspAB [Acidimicrobiales bacterium]